MDGPPQGSLQWPSFFLYNPILFLSSLIPLDDLYERASFSLYDSILETALLAVSMECRVWTNYGLLGVGKGHVYNPARSCGDHVAFLLFFFFLFSSFDVPFFFFFFLLMENDTLLPLYLHNVKRRDDY